MGRFVLNRSRVVLVVLTLIAAATPAVVASVLLWHFKQLTLFDHIPTLSDEILYWHQSATFGKVGFGGGFYTAVELTPRLGGFYMWGAAGPVFYGSIAAILGWPLWAIPVVNLAALGAAAIAFSAFVRANAEQIVWLGIFIGTFSPIIFYGPISMLEVLIVAASLALSGGFVALLRAWRDHKPVPRVTAIAVIVLLLYVAALRASWAPLFLPLLLLIDRPRRVTGWLAAGVKASFLAALPVVIFAVTAAPSSAKNITGSIASSPSVDRALSAVIENAAYNVSMLVQGDPVEMALRYAAIAVVAATTTVLIGAALQVIRHRTIATRWRFPTGVSFVAWFTLVAQLAFLVFVYEVEGFRSYRFLAGALLLVFGIAVAFRWRWLLVPAVALAFMSLPTTLSQYDGRNRSVPTPEQREHYLEYGPLLAEVLVFDETPSSRWCNTVLFDRYYLRADGSVMLAVPAGFGTSIATITRDGQIPLPPKSGYLAFTDDTYAQYREALTLEPLLALPQGMLYRNRDAECAG